MSSSDCNDFTVRPAKREALDARDLTELIVRRGAERLDGDGFAGEVVEPPQAPGEAASEATISLPS